MLQALKFANFTKLLAGRLISNIGDSFYMLSAMWLVYDLGGSTFYSGLAVFLTSIPRIVQFLYGPLIDRWPLKNMLVVTQLAQAILLLILPLGYWLDFISVTLVLILMPVIAVLNQFIFPAQMSALPKVLPKEHLTAGNAWFSAANQGSEAVFNALGGVLIALIGIASMFMMNSVLFLIASLIFMTLRPIPSNLEGKSMSKDQVEDESGVKADSGVRSKLSFRQYVRELKEGVTVLRHPYIIRLLAGTIVINCAGGAVFAVLPGFAQSSDWYGMMLASVAVFSMVGVLLAPRLRPEHLPMGPMYIAAFLWCGLAWFTAAQVSSMWLAVVLYGVGWVPTAITNIIAMVFMQNLVPAHLLGRVMAAVGSIGAVAMPIGSLLGGIGGAVLSSAAVLMISGLLVAFVAVVWLIDPVTRRMSAVTKMDSSMFFPQQGSLSKEQASLS
ncbi:MFS transporter [Paenibacillus agilis]|uniref:MFS transporter n=1 Tax=Paenibacillus agilis TaxID=3020863 RepID=A0A559IKS2_9BACL|nr:MFS transporter [Paenibacillus agilis]TVX88258.1 MFS transporter [Paenibacillus agilis]